MKIEKYTQKMQSAVMDAQNLAMSYGNQAIEVEHLHYAIVSDPDGLIAKLLEAMNVNVSSYKEDLKQSLEKLPKVSGGEVYL